MPKSLRRLSVTAITGWWLDIALANKAPATHAAQHAAGGSDPITPESIGAAPGGFGLGSEPSLFLDANDCVVNGWYRDANGNAKNVPWNYAHIFVTTYSAHIYIRQDAYITGGSASAPYVSHAVRIRHPNFLKENDFWGPWEYESGTPVYLGAEYRTTERYLGKPVYVKVVNCGNFVADKTVSWTDTLSEVIGIAGINVSSFRMTFPDSYITGDKIVLRGSDPWGGNIQARVKYIKTTD